LKLLLRTGLNQTEQELAISEQDELPFQKGLQANGRRGTANPRKIDIELVEPRIADDLTVKQRSSLVESGLTADLTASWAGANTVEYRGTETLSLEYDLQRRGSFCDRQVGLSVPGRRLDLTTSAGLTAGDNFIGFMAGVVDGVGGCTVEVPRTSVPLAASCGCLNRSEEAPSAAGPQGCVAAPCDQWLTAGADLATLSGFSEREVKLNVHERASEVVGRNASPIMSKPWSSGR